MGNHERQQMRKEKKTAFILSLAAFLLAGMAAYGQMSPDTAVIYYRQGGSEVDPALKGNRAALEGFLSRYREAAVDTTFRLVSLRVEGYASPEGSSELNSALARRRGERIVEYLRRYIDLPDSIVSYRSSGTDWTGLAALVAAEEKVPYKAEVLDVLRTVPEWIYDKQGRVTGGRKRQLGMLRGGIPYRWLLEHVFPDLRRSCIVLTYTVTPAVPSTGPGDGETEDKEAEENIEETEMAEIETATKTEAATEGEEDTGETAVTPATGSKEGGATFRPLLAVKTNLLAWATVMPDFRSYTFVPNLELEYFFADRWSLHAQGNFAKWSYRSGERFFGLSAWSVEPRWWPGGSGCYRWLYAGVYGEAGDYDVQDEGQRLDGTTGKLWSAGISVGAAIPFTDRFGLEVGIRGGYRRAQAREYVHEAGHYYLERAGKDNRWGITGLRASLYYRFGKSGRGK